ncbi:MAG: hypothetical protein KatS3mg009_2185 [Acidimicrobiia bacterium]|nr:MAG: hypothetical protein KatS3mg009_2185 [Acidimicrobiia bacterium]
MHHRDVGARLTRRAGRAGRRRGAAAAIRVRWDWRAAAVLCLHPNGTAHTNDVVAHEEASHMPVRVGVNGFGRIGRSFLRAVLARGEQARVELVAVNDPFGDAHTMAFLLKHDSVGGTLPNEVKETDGGFAVDGREIKKLDHRDPSEIPWGDHGVDVVIESTGVFTAREKAAGHLQGGAKRVVISAPSGDADVTLCMGVNDAAYDPARHTVISNASCTTNCLAPMAKVLDDRFGIEQGLITTVHAYTSDQQLQDQAVASRSGKPDLRRMRAAAVSIIPNTTGAARAIGLVLPTSRAASTAWRCGSPRSPARSPTSSRR